MMPVGINNGDTGASADADRATHERSQSPLSPPAVGVPCAFTPGPWKVVIDGTLTGAWAEVAQECVDPDTGETWDRELFRSETTHIRKADCYPPNGTFGGVKEAPGEWELTEDGAEHLANARLIASAPELYESCEAALAWFEDNQCAGGIASHIRGSLRKARGES